MDLNRLCMGCMILLDERAPACPACGWLEGTAQQSPQHLPPRAVLAGKYLIGKVLGQGGFGITYLAWDVNLKLKLAIKEYLPLELVTRVAGRHDVRAHSPATNSFFQYGLEKFLEEAKTLAQFVGHPNIVAVRDFFRTNSTAYLVMNHLEGTTLRDFTAAMGGQMPYQQVIDILTPVMDALKVIHRAGVLHRDISPDNIFITTKGTIVLIDFGAARQAMGDRSRSLSIILKPGYTPEEQYRSRGVQGPWTDVYALGATIYRLVTGRMPPESLDRLAEESLVPPSRLGVRIGGQEERALLKAMAVKAKDRFRSVQDFQQALLPPRRQPILSRRNARAEKQPAPPRPGSEQPTSGRPVPAYPAPGRPAPVQPTSGRPAPVQPDSGRPVPAQPGPVQPAPGRPDQPQPAPAQPAPIRPAAPGPAPGAVPYPVPPGPVPARGPAVPAPGAPPAVADSRPLWDPEAVEKFTGIAVLLALFGSIACLLIYCENSRQFLLAQFLPGERDIGAFYTAFIINNFALYLSLPLYFLFVYIGRKVEKFKTEAFTLVIFILCMLQCVTNLLNWLTTIVIRGTELQAAETIFIFVYYFGWPLVATAFLFLFYLYRVEGVGVRNVAISGNLLVLTGIACAVLLAIVTFAFKWEAAFTVSNFLAFSLLVVLTLPFFLHFNFRQDEPLDESEDTPDEPGTEQILLHKP